MGRLCEKREFARKAWVRLRKIWNNGNEGTIAKSCSKRLRFKFSAGLWRLVGRNLMNIFRWTAQIGGCGAYTLPGKVQRALKLSNNCKCMVISTFIENITTLTVRPSHQPRTHPNFFLIYKLYASLASCKEIYGKCMHKSEEFSSLIREDDMWSIYVRFRSSPIDVCGWKRAGIQHLHTCCRHLTSNHRGQRESRGGRNFLNFFS